MKIPKVLAAIPISPGFLLLLRQALTRLVQIRIHFIAASNCFSHHLLCSFRRSPFSWAVVGNNFFTFLNTTILFIHRLQVSASEKGLLASGLIVCCCASTYSCVSFLVQHDGSFLFPCAAAQFRLRIAISHTPDGILFYRSFAYST